MTETNETFGSVNENRFFNQFTRSTYDLCEYQNALNLSTKPLKYYVNNFDSPESQPFQEYSEVGNQKTYHVRNEYERPIPSRLNPIYQTYVEPYSTTPFLGSTHENRGYTNTSSQLRFGSDLRQAKSSVALSEVDLNRWSPGVYEETVQNAGQFAVPTGGRMQGQGQRYDPFEQNNILYMNSAIPISLGISTRNELHNYVNLNGC